MDGRGSGRARGAGAYGSYRADARGAESELPPTGLSRHNLTSLSSMWTVNAALARLVGESTGEAECRSCIVRASRM